MKIIKLIICSSFFTIVIIGCKKDPDTTIPEPQASFSTDKTIYFPGETIHLTNNSLNAYKFKWDFPDGTSSVAQNTEYTIDKNAADYSAKIVLSTFSQDNHISTLTKTVEVNQPAFADDYWGGTLKPTSKFYRFDTVTKRSSLIARDTLTSTDFDGQTLIISYKSSGRPHPGIYDLSSGDMLIESTFGWGNKYCSVCSSFSNTGKITVTPAASGRVRISFSIEVFPVVYGSHNPQHTYLSAGITF